MCIRDRSWENYLPAYEAAEEVAADEEALAGDIEKACDALRDAFDQLVRATDFSMLQAVVDEANGLDLNLYIDDEAMAAFKTVLAEAEELLLNADAAQADVDAKAVELSNAMAALRKIPNKDELNKLIAEMEQKDLDGYTDRSVAAFKAALSVAKTVAADANADEQAVAKAYTNLEAAANNLVKAEKPSTGNSGKGSTSANVGNAYGAAGVVSAAQGVTSQKAYVVSDTTVNFTLKRGSAYCFKMTVVNGNAMTPSLSLIHISYDNLQAAIEKLEFRADMSELQSLVDEANTFDPDDYIQDEAFDTFKSVLAEAEELLANANADQADVDAKAEALTRAMAALRKIPNKDELNKLIAEMEQKDLDGYTDRSVAAFKAALSVAKTVAADANADEQAVAKAYTNLEAAANNLVKAEKPSTGNSGKGSTSANVGNAYGAAGVVSAAQGVTSQKAYVVSDTTVNFTLKRGSAYCFKMTVVNGNSMVPSFTAGNGDVLKTQFVAKVGNDYYYRVYAIGTPGQSTGVYTTLPGQNAVKHCTVTIA